MGVRMDKGAILRMRALGKVWAEQGIWISRMAYLRLLLGINKWEDFFIFYQTLPVICLSATWLYSVPYICMKWQWKIHSKNNLSMAIYIFWKRKLSRIGKELLPHCGQYLVWGNPTQNVTFSFKELCVRCPPISQEKFYQFFTE